MLYAKQKINISSLILSRALFPLLQLFKTDEEYKEFRMAEENETVESFFKAHDSLTEEQKENAIAYYEVLLQTELIDIKIAKEIILIPNFDQDRWSHVQAKGIIEEYRYIKHLFEEHEIVNGQEILQLFERSIQLRIHYSDAIIALDKELKILERFDELPATIPSDEELGNLLDKNNALILAEALIKRIDPLGTEQIFTIEPTLKRKILIYLYREITENLILDHTLSEDDIDRLKSNQNDLVQYVLKQSEEPQYPAFIALIMGQFPNDFRQSLDYAMMLIRLGMQYKRSLIQLTDIDHIVLINVYEAALSKWELLEDKAQQNQQSNSLIENAHIQAHLELAESYQNLWEWEDALWNYKETARIAQATSNQTKFEYAIIQAIECLEVSFQYKSALDHCLAALANKRSTWKLLDSIELSSDIKKYLDIKFFNLTQVIKMDFKEVQSIIAKHNLSNSEMLIALYKSVDKDALNSDELKQLQQSQIDNQSILKQPYGANTEVNPDDEAMEIIYRIEASEKTIEAYKRFLDQLESLSDKLSPGVQLLYHLNLCTYNCLRGDRHALSEMEDLLYKMSEYPKIIGYALQGKWYKEYIHCLYLFEINNMDTYYKIEHAVGQATDLHLMYYLRHYHEAHTWTFLQAEWEFIYQAILVHMESCTEGLPKQSFLQLLWKLILFNRRAFHKYIGRENLTIADEKAYEKLQKKLNNSLWNHYNHTEASALKEAKSIIKEQETSVYPHYRNRDSFSQFKMRKPEVHSVLYHLFLKNDNKRRLLMISCKPNVTDQSEVFFSFHLNRNFDQIEALIEEEKQNKSIQWNAEGMLTLLSNSEKFNRIATELSPMMSELSESRVLAEFIHGLTETNDNLNKPMLHLYCDQFLHAFPFAMIRNRKDIPYGVHLPLASVLNDAYSTSFVNLYKGIAIIADVPASEGFTNLPYTVLESDQISRIFQQEQVEVYTLNDQEANKENVIEIIVEKRPSILHFAVHGVADNQLPPATAALVLAPHEEEESSALLAYHEVINWDLSGIDLVVLSACNSSVGRMSKGSPIQGMAYAFLAAGVSCVIGSRVKVSDEKTRIFMNQFYKELIKTEQANLAMQATRKYFYQNNQLSPLEIASWGLWI